MNTTNLAKIMELAHLEHIHLAVNKLTTNRMQNIFLIAEHKNTLNQLY